MAAIGYLELVIFLQGLPALILWLGYGLWMRKQSERLHTKLLSRPRNKNIGLGMLGFFGSAAIMLAGLFAISALGGMTKSGPSILAWIAIAALGLIFVHLQVLAAANFVVVLEQNVTPPPAKPSQLQDFPENKNS
ncbi:MAG: hypothetical protein J0L72_00205 [Armatimonadetes bacterium]|nr:hypothetical protein [Armatimonadota bacterium]